MIEKKINKYDKVLNWVTGNEPPKFITHTLLQTRFNIKYNASRRILHALQAEHIVAQRGNVRGEYEVWGQ